MRGQGDRTESRMTQRVLALVTIRMELPLAKITRDGDKSKSGGRGSRPGLVSSRTHRYQSGIRLTVGYRSLDLKEEFQGRDISHGILDI